MLPQKIGRKRKLLLFSRWGRSSSFRSRSVRHATLFTIRQRQALAEKRAAVFKQKYPFTRSTAIPREQDVERPANLLQTHSPEMKSETNSIEDVSKRQEQPSTKQKLLTIPQTSPIDTTGRPVRENRSVIQYHKQFKEFVFEDDEDYEYEEEERKKDSSGPSSKGKRVSTCPFLSL
jgi:hypothetical protein